MVGLSTILQTVEDIMTEQVVTLDGQETLAKAIETMQKGNFRHVPVVEKQKKLVGIISDRDILQHLPFCSRQSWSKGKAFRDRLFDVAPSEPALKQTVSHIMKCNPVHVLPDCDFYTAVKMLNETKISCLPVVHNEKKLVGIVTVTDVMRGLLAIYALLEKSVTTVKSVATVKLS
jgi:acetoin utilization protein AcuB